MRHFRICKELLNSLLFIHVLHAGRCYHNSFTCDKTENALHKSFEQIQTMNMWQKEKLKNKHSKMASLY